MFNFIVLWLYASYRESATATIAARLQAGTVVILQFLALLCPKSVALCDRLTLDGPGSALVFSGPSSGSAPLTLIPGLLVSWPSAPSRIFEDVDPLPSVFFETGLVVYTGYPLAVIPSESTLSSDYALVTVSGSSAGSTFLGAYFVDAVVASLTIWLVHALATAVRNAYEDEAEEVPEVYAEWVYCSEYNSQPLELEFQLPDSVPSLDTVVEEDAPTPRWVSVVSKLYQFIVALHFPYIAAVCPPPAALLDAAIRIQEHELQITVLIRDNATLSAKNDALHTENASSQHSITALTCEVDTISARLMTSENTVLQQVGTIGKLEKLVIFKDAVIKKKDVRLGEEKARYVVVAEKLDEANKGKEALQDTCDALEKGNAKLTQTLEETQVTAQTQHREIITLKQDNIGLQDDVARGKKALKEQDVEAESNRSELIAKCNRLNKANIDFEYSLKNANDTIDSLKDHIFESRVHSAQRIQSLESSHAEVLKEAEAERNQAQLCSNVNHMALYEQYDLTEAAQQDADAQRACAERLQADLIQEKAKTSHVRQVGRLLLEDFYNTQEELEAFEELYVALYSTPPAQPPQDDVLAPIVVASISSSTSLSVLASTSTDDILAIQLPEIASSTSIGGFAPLEDRTQAFTKSPAPVDDDPFDSDPMLVMPTFRFTRSAPPTPSRKLIAARHAGYNALQPSISVPIDMDFFSLPY
ncbi:hypothetical protein PENSPDRAFT_755243 [Peniophora sp. CONT]|nr:hypothetical protein PENSPDRAFT_755243 [Peniophora sp. CONT]